MRIQLYILATIVGILAWASAAVAGPTTNTPSVTLGWDRPADASVTGYAVYMGSASRLYTNRIPVIGPENVTCTVTNMARGQRYFFAVTSVAGPLESDYSNEVTWDTTPLPPVPKNPTIKQEAP